MRLKPLLRVLPFALIFGASLSFAQISPGHEWRKIVADRLPLYGHRNWIVIADSAYPAQSAPGIETILADAEQNEVLQHVLARVSNSKHVRPIVYTDLELSYLTEAEAAGVDAYREFLSGLFADVKPVSLPHEHIIGNLAKASQNFQVLIIKTRMTIPYTTVFLQLDCAYWSGESERKLRSVMAQKARR
ncbi:MAG: hypothetical protein ACJ746_15660 [Bryobacteraceae bacterium]